MKTLKFLAAAVLLSGAAYFAVQHHAQSQQAEAAADRFFSDPGFTEDYSSSAQWREVEEKDESNPLQVMLARKAHGPR